MIPSIYSLSRALLSPATSLRSLGADASVVLNADGMPQLVRTSHFVEAQINTPRGRLLVAMPLTVSATKGLEVRMAALRKVNSSLVGGVKILPQELVYEDSWGLTRSCDLVVQEMPYGANYEDVVRSGETQKLQSALVLLERELKRLEISHHNLKPQNLVYRDGVLYPIRWWMGSACDGDSDSRAIEQMLGRLGCSVESEPQNGLTSYKVSASLSEYSYIGNVFDNMICVQNEYGYGYVDTKHEVVIEPHFEWADDFHEGRAVVQLPNGMGLIDKQGRYVIEPEYEIVEYGYTDGIIAVRKSGLWANFDYNGVQITSFMPREKMTRMPNS